MPVASGRWKETYKKKLFFVQLQNEELGWSPTYKRSLSEILSDVNYSGENLMSQRR